MATRSTDPIGVVDGADGMTRGCMATLAGTVRGDMDITAGDGHITLLIIGEYGAIQAIGRAQ